MAASAPCDESGRKPVLIVVHQPTSTPGRIGMKLTARGHSLDIRRPCMGHALPERLDDHAGVVIFGGPQSANDDEPYLREEMRLIGRALDQNAPFLGVCLGAQMLAKYLGGKVALHPEGRAEIGYYPIRPTREGLAVMECWPSHVYQWHKEGFDVPSGATLLVESDGDFSTQAIQAGPCAFGIQFHPEVTLAMVHRWTTKAEHRLALPGAQSKREQIIGRYMHDDAVDLWIEAFLERWLSRDVRGMAQAAE